MMMNLPDDVVSFLEENLNASKKSSLTVGNNGSSYTYGGRHSSSTIAAPETNSFPYRMETENGDQNWTGVNDAQWFGKNSVVHHSSQHAMQSSVPNSTYSAAPAGRSMVICRVKVLVFDGQYL